MEHLFDVILEEDEHIVKIIKPSKSRYWKFFLTPFLVPIFLPHFIVIMSCTLFFTIPLLYARSYKNLYYAYTNKRLIVRCGTIGINYKTMNYTSITSMTVNVGLLDKGKTKTGTLLFKDANASIRSKASIGFEYVETPYELMEEIKEYMSTICNVQPELETSETQDGDAQTLTISQKEREQSMVEAVNSASHFESRVNMANYEMQSVREGMKNAPKWGVALGLTFFFLLIADLITATILLINKIFVGAIVCAVVFGVVIITAFICTVISRARAMNGDIRNAKKIIKGKVKTCFMASMTSTRSGGSQHHQNADTVRINNVTYRVVVIADDGEEYGAFSKRFYKFDEEITIAVMGKRRAKIVEGAELEKYNSSTNDNETNSDNTEI